MTRAARSLVSNPPWVTKILTDHWGDLEAKVKPAWLPKLDDVHAVRGGHVQGDFSELGCGAYGCVYPTLDPGIVLKVTTDPTEAEFAARLAKDLAVPITTTYRMVMSLPVKHEKRRVYLLWREEASEVGAIEEDSTEDHLIYRQHKAAQVAYDILIEQTQGDLDAALEAWKHEVRSMIMMPELRFLANGLLKVYDQQQIFFGDIHAGNLGKVKRDGKDVWVITDPGHVAVLGDDERQEQIAVANPHKEGVGRWKAPDIFGKSLNARMLRILWERGSMSQAEFMQRYHKVGASLEGERRPTRLTDGKTAFLNNLGRYVRGRARLPDDYMPSQEGITVHREKRWPGGAGFSIETAGGDAYKRSNLIRQEATRYLQPIERRIGEHRVGDAWHGQRQDGPIILHWVGPSIEEWLTSLDNAELDKAYQSMEALAIGSGNDLDATWVKRLAAEIARRGGGPADYRRVVKNPARPDLDQVVSDLLKDPDPAALETIKDVCMEHGDFATVLAGIGERMFEHAHRGKSHAKLTQWLLQNASFEVFADHEDIPPEFDDPRDIEFARTANDNNVWPWCYVTVTANYGDFQGDEHLGGCSYQNQSEFTRPGGYYDDMKRSAIGDLISEMPDHLIETLSNNVVAGAFYVSSEPGLGNERSVEWYMWPVSRTDRSSGRLVYHAWRRFMNYTITGHHWQEETALSGTLDENRQYAAVAAFLSLPLLRVNTGLVGTLKNIQKDIHAATTHVKVASLIADTGGIAKRSRKQRKR